MSDNDVTITRTPKRRRFTFGPGSLEAMALSAWTTKHGVGKLRIQGQFTVYCGNGGEHVVSIRDERHADTFDGCSPEGAAASMISDWLDDEWSDPCDDHAEDFVCPACGRRQINSFGSHEQECAGS